MALPKTNSLLITIRLYALYGFFLLKTGYLKTKKSNIVFTRTALWSAINFILSIIFCSSRIFAEELFIYVGILLK